jgi:hypothetical protein
MRKKGRKRLQSKPKAAGRNADSKPSLALSIYEKIPSLPLLDRSGTALLLACAAFYIIFIIYVFMITPPVQITNDFIEAPIHKNSQLALLPGEKYTYDIPVQGTVMRLSYDIGSGPGCHGTLVSETYGKDTMALCLGQDGMLANSEGKRQENFGFGNQSIMLFSPWMLAVSENFSWSAGSTVSAAGAEIKSSVFFTSAGRRTTGGRETYAIELRADSPTSAPIMTMYIDAQKRVLVMAESGNSSIRLFSAPFQLDWSGTD